MKEVRKTAWGLISLLALSTLGGCISYKPLPFDPVDELQNLQARSVENSIWEQPVHYYEEYFPISREICLQNGLTLSQANSLALFYSPEILKARNDLHIREAILLEAGAPKNPEIFLGPRVSTRDAALIFPGSLTFQALIVDWLGPQRAAAQWEKEKSLWLLLNTEIEVLASIQKKFLEVEANRKREEIAYQQVWRAKEIEFWVNSHYSSGEMDLLSFQISLRGLEDAKVKLMDAILLRKKSERDLLKLVGLLPDSEVELLLGHLPLLDIDIKELTLNQILNHPLLKANEVEYYAAEQTLRAEIAKQYPALDVGPQFESSHGDLSVGFGLGFEIPVFIRNRTAIGIAEEKRNRLRICYDEKLLNLDERLANLKDEFQLLTQRLRELQPTLVDTKGLERIFSETFESSGEGVLQALAASDSIGNTLLEEAELKRRIGQVKIDLLVTSASLLPTNCATYIKERGQ